MSGHFVPGQVLTYRGLSADLGTSVMPVREAVARLASAEVLEILPNRSIRVPPLERARFDETWRARVLLEGEVAGWAAAHITPDEISTVESVQKEVLRALEDNRLGKFLRGNRILHFTIYGSARTSVVLPLIEFLWMHAGPQYRAPLQRYMEENREVVIRSASFHNDLIDALRNRNSSKAKSIRQKDIRFLRDMVLKYIEFVD